METVPIELPKSLVQAAGFKPTDVSLEAVKQLSLELFGEK
jgi:hypothetical protein